jgi:FlgD Ig-like domain
MTLLAVALLVGCAAAFTYTESLKLERKPVTRVRLDRWLSPTCDCPGETAKLSFRLREAEQLDVTMVDGDGDRVRILESALEAPAGRVVVTWDGLDEAGQVVPDGPYRLRLHLRDERRSVEIPEDVNVDTRAPRVRLASVSPTLLASGDRVDVRFRIDELAKVVLLVDGVRVPRGGWRRPGARTLAWGGIVDGVPVSAGTHALALEAEDRAGNVSAPTPPERIVVTET